MKLWGKNLDVHVRQDVVEETHSTFLFKFFLKWCNSSRNMKITWKHPPQQQQQKRRVCSIYGITIIVCIYIYTWFLHGAHGRILAANPFAAMNGVAADSRLGAYPDPKPSEAPTWVVGVGIFSPRWWSFVASWEESNLAWEVLWKVCGKRKYVESMWTFETEIIVNEALEASWHIFCESQTCSESWPKK